MFFNLLLLKATFDGTLLEIINDASAADRLCSSELIIISADYAS
jgi:hypothetical protein